MKLSVEAAKCDEINARSVVFCQLLIVNFVGFFSVGTVDYHRLCRPCRYLMQKVSISVVFCRYCQSDYDLKRKEVLENGVGVGAVKQKVDLYLRFEF